MPRSLKEYERHAWVLAGWREVWVSAVHGQVQNFYLSCCQQLLGAAQLAATAAGARVGGGAGGSSSSSSRTTVEAAAASAAPFCRQPTLPLGNGAADDGSEPAATPPAPLLALLSRLCLIGEQEAVGQALMLLQQLYPEHQSSGGSNVGSGGEELPLLPASFLPSELGRQLGATGAALLQGYVDAHTRLLALAVAASSAVTEWGPPGGGGRHSSKEARAPREICDLLLERVAGGWVRGGWWAGGQLWCGGEGGAKNALAMGGR